MTFSEKLVPVDLSADVAAVSQIDAVSLILDVICQTTNMGFVAVARMSRFLNSVTERLFHPFSRRRLNPSQNKQGLGLGLYIASKIARAHEGTLVVASNAQVTRFTFHMPLV